MDEGSRESTPRRVHAVVPAARTLVLHPGALGDFVQAVPAFAALRAAAGSGHLAVATAATVAELAEATGLFDEVLVYDAAALYHGRLFARIAVIADLVRRLRARDFETAVIFKAAPAYAWVARAARVPNRVAFTRAAAPPPGLLTAAVRYVAGRHRAVRYDDLVRAAGADPSHRAAVRWAESPRAPELLDTSDGRRLLVGLAPGGARNAKEEMAPRRWPAERYAELARRLACAEPRVRYVLLGATTDVAEAAVVRGAVGPHVACDLTGCTTPAEARAIIDRLDVFVGNDSGLLHLAATTDTPAVAIFGPSDPREACPQRDHVRALWNPARPTPCLDDVTGRLRACVTPCCIDRVSVDAVLDAVLDAVHAPRRARGAGSTRRVPNAGPLHDPNGATSERAPGAVHTPAPGGGSAELSMSVTRPGRGAA